MRIIEDDLRGPEIAALLGEHMASMHENSPPGSVHALDLARLRSPDVTFWSAWDGSALLGCGALKELAPDHGEIKSMRTATPHLRRGVASAMLEHILAEARRRAYARVSLETGTGPAFDAAHALYARHGFRYCDAFGDYVATDFNRFMTLLLG